ncbi:hypothetical protein Fmac_011662 [Flemingia macrophylla]|uniref:GDSL esterase/lipase n=1 Tax=Flemingia macrophylla TaxID=520843 RepID=A0ABD1MNF9_9FABA
MNIFIIFSITFAYVFLGNGLSNANPLPYEAIFNFGDSISDTGNAATNHPTMPSNSPYGSTYFKHPSVRLSNGRLILDFIVEAYGLPMLQTYLNLTDGQDIKKGVNFAYAGSTALDQTILKQKSINVDAAAYSLRFSSGKLETFKACCGKGEPYGLSAQFPCGSFSATVCSDPSKHINWDGPHFTEAAYRLIAKGLVEGPIANPSMKSPHFKIV